MATVFGEMGMPGSCDCRGLDEQHSFDNSTLFLKTAAWLSIQKKNKQMNHKTKPEEKKPPNLLGHFQ